MPKTVHERISEETIDVGSYQLEMRTGKRNILKTHKRP